MSYGFTVYGLRFRAYGLRFAVCGLGLRVARAGEDAVHEAAALVGDGAAAQSPPRPRNLRLWPTADYTISSEKEQTF